MLPEIGTSHCSQDTFPPNVSDMTCSTHQVAPLTIHPAFEKAASYFDVRLIHVPLLSDLSPDVDAYKKVS